MKILFFSLVIISTFGKAFCQLPDPIKVINKFENTIENVRFSPDGKFIIVQTRFNDVKCYNLSDTSSFIRIWGRIENFSISPNSKIIASCGNDFALTNIETKSYNKIPTSYDSNSGTNIPNELFFNNAGTILYAEYLDYNNRLKRISSFKIPNIWNSSSIEYIQKNQTNYYINNDKKNLLEREDITLFFDNENELIIKKTGYEVSIYKIGNDQPFDFSDCKMKQTFLAKENYRSGYKPLMTLFAKNSKYFVVILPSNSESYIYIYDYKNFKISYALNTKYCITEAKINPINNMLVAFSNSLLEFIDLNTGQFISSIPFNLKIEQSDISSDGTKILAYYHGYRMAENKIYIWDFNQLLAYSFFSSKINNDLTSNQLFQPKGEYESIAEYKIRCINQKQYKDNVYASYSSILKDTIDLLINKKVNRIKNSLEHIKLKILEIGTYDSEKQYFPINIENFGNTQLNVPISEAKSLKDNLAKTVVEADKQLGIDGKTWKYKNLTVTHPLTGIRYPIPSGIPLYIDYMPLNTSEFGVPKLEATMKFIEPSGNNLLDGDEKAKIEVTIKNSGTGTAQNIKINLSAVDHSGFTFDNTKTIIGIAPNQSQTVYFDIIANRTISDKEVPFKFNFSEARGFNPADINYTINAQSFRAPLMLVKDVGIKEITGNDNSMIENGENIEVSVLVQNSGQGKAENAKAKFDFADRNILSLTPDKMTQNLGELNPGESKLLTFNFTVNNVYSGSDLLPIKVILSEKYNEFGGAFPLKLEMKKVQLAAKSITVKGQYDQKIEIKDVSLTSDVDKNIPETTVKNANRFALIIGNEDYSTYQTGLNTEVNVDFARNDAQVFKQYCEKTLGVAAENITFLPDATSGKMNQALTKLNLIAKNSNGQAELIFYYAGHGLPDENTKEPYLIPVDVSGTNFKEGGIKLSNVYEKLTEYPSQKVSVFIDACFSGGARNQGLLAARGVKMKPKESVLSGNIVVFSASNGEQSSLPYKDKQHGMFTYFLLKKIQETKGDISFTDLAQYVKSQVSLQSVNINSKEQNPVVSAGTDKWENWKLK